VFSGLQAGVTEVRLSNTKMSLDGDRRIQFVLTLARINLFYSRRRLDRMLKNMEKEVPAHELRIGRVEAAIRVITLPMVLVSRSPFLAFIRK
jgi:hypothetical protein